MLRWLNVILLALLPLTGAAQEVGVPVLTERVTDLTSTLTIEQKATLTAKLQALEAQKASQIAVLLIPTTQPETIEQYAIRVVEKWKLGREKIDDGVLLLIAKSDRKLRIEVGYGLEGVLPDMVAKRIITEDISPHLRQGDFYSGILAGITRLDAIIQGEAMLSAVKDSQSNERQSSTESNYLFLIFAALISGAFLRRILGTVPGALVNGGLVGLATMWLGGGLIFAILFGLIAFFFALIKGSDVGNWGGGGFGGGGHSHGVGGGGFSGGGGSFGGGGASGDW
jgi:uncharacterized protein